MRSAAPPARVPRRSKRPPPESRGSAVAAATLEGRRREIRASGRDLQARMIRGAFAMALVVRNCFVAKPGSAGTLATKMKEAFAAAGVPKHRVLTDLTGDLNRVI